MKRVFASMFSLPLLTVSPSAISQTEAQFEAVTSLASATMLVERCGSARINDSMIGALFEMADLSKSDIETGPLAEFAQVAVLAFKSQVAEMKPLEACAVAKKLYGPNGSTTADMVLFD